MKIAVAGTGYVGLSIATLLAQHNEVVAVDVIPEKVELINNKKCLIIVGRGSLCEDVSAWAEEILKKYSRAICEMWIRPSILGKISANAPKVVILTTLTVITEPAG